MIPRSLLIGVAALLVVVVAMGIYLRQMRHRASELEYSSDALPRSSARLRSNRNRDALRSR